MAWLRGNPELLEQLNRMRRLEADDGSDSDLDRLEPGMLELVKSMGTSSFGRCVQGKEDKAFEAAKAQEDGRLPGKKIKLHQSAGQGHVHRARAAPWKHHCAAGEAWAQAVKMAGWGLNTRIHALAGGRLAGPAEKAQNLRCLVEARQPYRDGLSQRLPRHSKRASLLD